MIKSGIYCIYHCAFTLLCFHELSSCETDIDIDIDIDDGYNSGNDKEGKKFLLILDWI